MKMKISELISRLEELKEINGDIDVTVIGQNEDFLDASDIVATYISDFGMGSANFVILSPSYLMEE